MPSEGEITEIKTRLDELSKKVEGLVDSVKKESPEVKPPLSNWESAVKNTLRSEIGGRDGVASCLAVLFREAGNEGYWFRNLRDDAITSYSPEQMLRLLAPLSNGQRLRILKSLADGTRTSAELGDELDVKGGPLYHHLRELMNVGYVKSPNRNAYLLTLEGWFALMMASLLTSLLEGDEEVAQLVVKQPQDRSAEAEVPMKEMPGLIGQSEVVQQLKKSIRLAAKSNLPVIIKGEPGTGKGLVARLIHDISDRASSPYFEVNCAALSEEFAEYELFGYERGAFGSATNRGIGFLEQADGGTLLLDNISESGMNIQARLLCYIESGILRRVGGRGIKVNVKVVAATNLDLAQAVKDGKFREDLYYRLNVMPVHLPPLSEHKEDIPLLLEHFLTLAANENNMPVPQVSESAGETLLNYDFPGNVRELKNLVERALMTSEGQEIQPEHLGL